MLLVPLRELSQNAIDFENFVLISFFYFWNIVLVRADISRPPFATSFADAVHAGTALRC